MYFVHPQFKNITLGPFFKKFSKADLKNKLAKFFPKRDIIFTDSGRSAFGLAVKQLNLENSEMLFPAYICDIFLPIFKHYDIKPIFLDIDLRTFNVLVSEIEKKITPKTKSILVCHTYGLPNDMGKILEIAKKYNLKIIEDCAQSFEAKFEGKYLGNFGDYAFFSLPKFLPVINGGMLVSKKPIKINLKKSKFKLSNLIKFMRLFPCLATFSELFRKMGNTLANNKFTLPKTAPKYSLKLFDWYLENFDKTVRKRIELAEFFQKELKKLKFEVQKSENNNFTFLSALVSENLDRNQIFKKLRKYKIFCSRIWHQPIILNSYPPADGFPNTIEAAKRIINFPLQNWFKRKDINKMLECLKCVIGQLR